MGDTPNTPPLVDVKVTNPIEYIKIWWNRIIGNEGVDFSFHIKPLTAIAISIVIVSVGFGLGRFTLPFDIPFFQFIAGSPSPTPTQSPNDIWKETAFTGTLQHTVINNRYFLITTSSAEAITLQVPLSIDLTALVGKRILTIGNYNKNTKVLVVTDTKDLEVLPKTPVPLPTITPTPESTSMPSSTPNLPAY